VNKADLNKLNRLFEKMVDNVASVSEQKQLELLYQIFITEGREGYNNVIPFTAEKKVG
jgi:hypothetical protein